MTDENLSKQVCKIFCLMMRPRGRHERDATHLGEFVFIRSCAALTPPLCGAAELCPKQEKGARFATRPSDESMSIERSI